MGNNRRKHNKSNLPAEAVSPPMWLSTEALEDLLLASILEQSRGSSEDEEAEFEEIDTYYSLEDLESEEDHRCSGLRLLAITAPILADLLGGQTSEIPS